jgi:CheY-like chemotaxis protein
MLIVEDDDLSVMVMKKIFRDDFEITACDSADNFYQNYSNINFDIIIMDISLKGPINGFELIKEIKKLPAFSGTSIVCFTAHADAKARKNAIESGADRFITKPVSNHVLKETVASVMKE